MFNTVTQTPWTHQDPLDKKVPIEKGKSQLNEVSTQNLS